MPMPNRARELQLREELNRWAEAGRGEAMEEHHLPIVGPTLALMDLQPADRVLDLGCGNGHEAITGVVFVPTDWFKDLGRS
jgi:protein-L-isoaspartate O-methyltransferase